MAKYTLGQQVFLIKNVDIQKGRITEIRTNASGTRYLVEDPLETTEPNEEEVLTNKAELRDYFLALFAKLQDL